MMLENYIKISILNIFYKKKLISNLNLQKEREYFYIIKYIIIF